MLQSGDILGEGRYEIEGVLGKGGMATVFLVRDTRLRVARALKILDPELSVRAGLRKRFEVEAHSMAKLSHPNIVRVFDVVDEGSHFYIVMELIEGASVLERIDDGPMELETALGIASGVMSALGAAHEAGIIHRDIKPHNLLLTTEGEVRVSDFGIAQCNDFAGRSVTRTGAVMGTWAFMAPEQRADAKGVDPGADIYSAGATLFAMVTGLTPPDLFAAEIDPAMYEEVPRPVREIIRRATRYWSWERYPNADAMREDLDLVRDRVARGQLDSIDLRLREEEGRPPVQASTPPPLPPQEAPAPVLKVDPRPRTLPPRPPRSREAPPASRLGIWLLLAVGLASAGVWYFVKPTTTLGTLEARAPDRRSVPSAEAVASEEAVEEARKPALEHVPPEEVVLDEQAELRARIHGSQAYDQVIAFYRPNGTSTYRQTRLNRAGARYRGYLPVDRTMSAGLEYYIEASSYATGMPLLRSGSPEAPHRLIPRP